MPRLLIRGSLLAVGLVLSLVGATALLLTALVAAPLVAPPELRAISEARASVDYSALPAVERFQAHDGTMLGFRHYPASGPAAGRAAIVIHGSSGSSGTTIHALSGALAAHGVETFAIDIRGHGASGTRGDIGYVGQLEEPVLVLALYDEGGTLYGFGSTYPLPRAQTGALLAIAPRGWETGKPIETRWGNRAGERWTKLPPELVAEVAVTHVDHGRLRHLARFLRWRPDRDPRSCTAEQLWSRPS